VRPRVWGPRVIAERVAVDLVEAAAAAATPGRGDDHSGFNVPGTCVSTGWRGQAKKGRPTCGACVGRMAGELAYADGAGRFALSRFGFLKYQAEPVADGVARDGGHYEGMPKGVVVVDRDGVLRAHATAHWDAGRCRVIELARRAGQGEGGQGGGGRPFVPHGADVFSLEPPSDSVQDMVAFVQGVLMTLPDGAYGREGIGPSVQAPFSCRERSQRNSI